MRTFLFDTFNRYKRLSESLDVETTLCNKTWFVFNNSGEREIYIFQEKGKLKISLNGKVTHATWEYIPANKSLIISGNEQSYMVHAAYVDNILFALQIDGTQEYAFLIDENSKQNFLPQSYNDIKQYFQIKEQELIQKQEFERLENKRLLTQKREEEEEERRETLRKRKILELQSKANGIKDVNVRLHFLIYIICFFASLALLFIIGSLFEHKVDVALGVLIALLYGLIGIPFVMFGIPYFIIKSIKRNKVREWKEKHPNDPVNQYL